MYRRFAILGFSFFRSGLPGLRSLDRSLARLDGWGNFATGRFAVETRLVSHASEVAPAGRPALGG